MMSNDTPATEDDSLLGNNNRLSAAQGIEAPGMAATSQATPPSTVVESILEVINEGVEGFVEGAQAVAGHMEEAGMELRTDIVSEFHEVKDAMLEEMHEADDGGNFFLEMSLARNLSILPTDIVHVAQTDLQSVAEAPHLNEGGGDEGGDIEGTPNKTEVTPQRTPISAYFILASAVIALSSVGPILDLQQGCTPTMKIYWRMSATAMVLFPFAAVSVKKEGLPRLSVSQWSTFLCTAACYATMCTSFVQALRFTSVGNAVILGNSQAIMLLLGKFLVGARISVMEGSGAVTAFIGAILCSMESSHRAASSDQVGGVQGLTWLGDIFALMAGLGGVFYLILAKATRAVLGLYVFMFLIMAVGSTVVLLFLTFVLREEVSISRDINHGIWGWSNMTPNRFPLEVTMVLICNICGALGYVRSMQYFDNLVISVAALMEPVIAEFTAFFFGVGLLPGLWGWVGNILVACGTFAVVAPKEGSKSEGLH